MTADINIQDYLPHREPMLMVDRLIEIGNKKVTTAFTIHESNIFVENGFFSATGLIENMAQTCSAITGQDLGEELHGHYDPGSKVIGFITNIKKVSVYSLPEVGDEIVSKAVLKSQFGDICTIACEIFLKEKPLVEAEISLYIKAL